MTHPDLSFERQDDIAIVRLERAAKRNALNDGLILALRDTFQNLPEGVGAVVIDGAGDHFCAGLDLSELKERNAGQGVLHSRMWHQALDCVQSGPVPVIAALHGAVVGGGLELASACHIRVADDSTFYALPEGSRGIFVGGGGSVRLPRLMGVARMTDLMLTGRIAANAPMSNFAVMQALPRIADQSQSEGLFTESLMAAVTESTAEAQERLRAFLDKRAGKVLKQG
jgi:enoyl-CoA hydratase/carnithine racemase